MGMGGIVNARYQYLGDVIIPLMNGMLGLIGLAIGFSVGQHGATIGCLYMLYESADAYLDAVSDEALEDSVVNAGATARVTQLQGASTCVGAVFFAHAIYTCINPHETLDTSFYVEMVLFSVAVVLKMIENLMEVAYAEEGHQYKVLMYAIQDRHVTSVVRDGYRLFLSGKKPDGVACEKILNELQVMQETFPPRMLASLRYESRVRNVTSVLTSATGTTTPTNAYTPAIWSEFGITSLSDLRVPSALEEALKEPCPFHRSALVGETHTYFFLPAAIERSGSSASGVGFPATREALDAKSLGERMKHFIPGIGVIWRYDAIDEDPRDEDYWVLMYKGAPGERRPDGIVPGSLNSTWSESMRLLAETDGQYKAMTNAEVIVGAYTHLVRTGEVLFPEKFTRVVETISTQEFGKKCGGSQSHLFIGRFNMSGLNNDAYIDMGGDLCKHPLRGLSACRRFV